MGMGAVGEEALEQQTFLGQLVEMRGDVQRAAQGANEVASEAFHQDHHHVLDWQRALGWRGEVTANRGAIGIYQLIVRRQEHLAHGLERILIVQGGLPGIVAMGAKGVGGRGVQGQGAIQAQLIGEHRVSGISIAPAQRRALAQMTARGHHGNHQAQQQRQPAPLPWQ